MSDKETLQQEYDQFAPNSRRLERRAARRAGRQADGVSWLVGFVLIAFGVLFLLVNAGILPALTNWWALFMLLPAVGVFSAALGAHRRNGGHWTPEVTGLLVGGLLFVALTAVFLFELNYGLLVPLFLIAAGLLLLAGPVLSRG
jgi:pheromone shutdown protein TraB